MADSKNSVRDVLDTLDRIAEEKRKVSIGDVTEALGGRGFGPLITLPALLVMTPLGGIPLVPSLMALLIALFALQVVAQRSRLWLPDWLERRSVDDGKIEKSVNKLRGAARWIDRHFGNRLEVLTRQPAPPVAACIVLLLCVFVPFAEMIPFAAILPMGAVALIGLALTLRDGVLMLLGMIAASVGVAVIWIWAF
ncbi:exopolysaccharide biosynthesis protein [Sulfitobacter aestuarii]|uniref:Exopolysaccharide biosynthesis protein n=1 Tax=Sulfitobacter aestuarii TaxID=2161676 RepID=A0ABW5U3T5_9RHOB